MSLTYSPGLPLPACPSHAAPVSVTVVANEEPSGSLTTMLGRVLSRLMMSSTPELSVNEKDLVPLPNLYASTV